LLNPWKTTKIHSERLIQAPHHCARDENAGDRGDDADAQKDRAHLALGKTRLEEERGRHAAGKTIRVFVRSYKEQNQQRSQHAEALKKIGEWEHHSFHQSSRRRVAQNRLRRDKRGRDPDDHQQRKDEIHDWPRHSVGQKKSERAGRDHCDAIAHHEDRRTGPHFTISKDVGAICVERDILRRTEEGDRDRVDRQHLQSRPRVVKRHCRDREEQ
jgi:hypothetical protein